MMLNHRIDTFMTLYQEMNYRKTAEIRNMTQPGVTQHIQYLENAYGVKLFNYDGKQLTRTKYADILYRHINAILQDEKALREALAPSPLFYLRAGVTKTIGEFIIAPQVSRFLRQENNKLELIVDNTAALLALLDKGELDFAIIEGVFDKSKYQYRLFKKERFLGICSKAHPFAGKTVSWDALFKESLLLRERGSGTRGLFERVLADFGYSIDWFKRVNTIASFTLIQNLVSQGTGITFAYQSIADAHENLATFETEDLVITNEMHYVYTNERVAADKICRFTE